jgi:hypothetical protein
MKDLESHKINHGFQVPQDYFQEIETQVVQRIRLEEKLSKKNAFAVPQDYFETVESRVFEKLQKEKSIPKVISIFRSSTFKITASIAALFLLFVSVFSIQKQQQMFSLEVLDAEYISQMIESDYFNFSDADLEQLISIEDINLSTAEIPEEDLIEYLTNTFDNNDLLIGE